MRKPLIIISLLVICGCSHREYFTFDSQKRARFQELKEIRDDRERFLTSMEGKHLTHLYDLTLTSDSINKKALEMTEKHGHLVMPILDLTISNMKPYKLFLYHELEFYTRVRERIIQNAEEKLKAQGD